MADAQNDRIDAFISRWRHSGANERANYVMYLTELCTLLDLPQPEPAKDDGTTDYRFEYPVKVRDDDGKASTGRIDLYKKACFVLEAKQGTDEKLQKDLPLVGLLGNGKTTIGTAKRGTDAYKLAMQRARRQAEGYAKALPPSHGWPPFLLVVDLGHSIECAGGFKIGLDILYRAIEQANHKLRSEAATGARETQNCKLLAPIRNMPDLLEPDLDTSRDKAIAVRSNGDSGGNHSRHAPARPPE